MHPTHLVNRIDGSIVRYIQDYPDPKFAIGRCFKMLKEFEIVDFIMLENQEWEIEGEMRKCILVYDLNFHFGFLIVDAEMDVDRKGPLSKEGKNLGSEFGFFREKDIRFDN